MCLTSVYRIIGLFLGFLKSNKIRGILFGFKKGSILKQEMVIQGHIEKQNRKEWLFSSVIKIVLPSCLCVLLCLFCDNHVVFTGNVNVN